MRDSTKNRRIALFVFVVLVLCLFGDTLYRQLWSGIRKIELVSIEKRYPKVMSTTETLRKILSGKSIARFGDGELKLIMGIGLGNKGDNDEYQVYDKKLSNRLKEIIKSPTENCVVAINSFCDKWDDSKFDGENFSWWETFWLTYWKKLKNIYREGYTYGCAEISRVTVFKENDLKDIKKIWNKKKVLFVVGRDSYFLYEKRLFDNVKSAKMLVVPGKSSFNKYNSILDKIRTFDKEYLILLSLGPCATVLAYDLSKDGYQALDIGHLPNSYLTAIGEREKPEKEHVEDKRFLLEEGVYDLTF